MCVNSCDTQGPSICAKEAGLSSNEEEDMANGDFLKIALRGELLAEEVTNMFSPPNPHCFLTLGLQALPHGNSLLHE